MKEFYQFASSHPFLAIVFALIAAQVVAYPFNLLNRLVRLRNIKNAGWPPAHLDADGDPIKPAD